MSAKIHVFKGAGGWTETASGQRFYHREPDGHNFRLYDIAHQLAQVNRYGGACRWPYSVAQHSVLMADYAMQHTGDPMLALDCIFHDAAEAYLGDMKKPVKDDLPDYQELEAMVQTALRWSFAAICVPPEQTDFCRELDRRIVFDEKAQVMLNPHITWNTGPPQPLGIKIARWSFEKSRRRYAQAATKYAELMVGTDAAHNVLWER